MQVTNEFLLETVSGNFEVNVYKIIDIKQYPDSSSLDTAVEL